MFISYTSSVFHMNATFSNAYMNFKSKKWREKHLVSTLDIHGQIHHFPGHFILMKEQK